MIIISTFQAKLLRVKLPPLHKRLLSAREKCLEKVRRPQNQALPPSTVTGWWSLSRRAALRTGWMWRYRAVLPSSLPPVVYTLGGLLSSDSSSSLPQFGIEDLKALPDQTGCWDGVRNYQVKSLRSAQNHSWGLILLFIYCSLCLCRSAGAQLHEANEGGPAGFLLSQQLQGAWYSRTHEGRFLS